MAKLNKPRPVYGTAPEAGMLRRPELDEDHLERQFRTEVWEYPDGRLYTRLWKIGEYMGHTKEVYLTDAQRKFFAENPNRPWVEPKKNEQD